MNENIIPIAGPLTRRLQAVRAEQPEAPERCSEHPAYDADYCPICGTARVIGIGR